MKLRMQGNSLRLRLTRTEVERLRDSGEVAETACFHSGGTLIYRVQKSAGDAGLQAGLANGTISVSIPAAAVELWAKSDEVGVYGQDGELKIAIEKDYRCLTRASEEQEADAYPHPAEHCSA